MRPGLAASRNLLKATVLLGGLPALLGVIGWWLGGARLATVFGGVGLAMSATVVAIGPRALLASLGARELALAEAPALHSAAERLARVAGLPRPSLFVLEDGFPRLLSVGRGGGELSIAISRGLLRMAPAEELDGLLAHEISHARLRDTAVQTPVVLLALWLLEASRIGGFLQRFLLLLLTPLAASLVHLMLSPKRELLADAAAARLCGSPHGLADALSRLEKAMELVDFRGSPATEPLYVDDPFGGDRLSRWFRTHPPVEERVRRLRALDPEWRDVRKAA